MELRQLQYFVRVVELGSMSRAALELDMVQSAISQQISRLESELSTRLLRRAPHGVTPTEAGLAFFHEAQLTLRHAEQAKRAAHQARLSGTVSVGLAPTTASVIGVPLMRAMRERYPDVRLHMVESLSGHLTAMLNARQLDLAVLFDTNAARRWTVMPLLEETLFLIRSRAALPQGRADPPTHLSIVDLVDIPLIMPTGLHGLRSTLDAAFARSKVVPNVVQEVDSLAMLMDAVDMGFGATLQPWAAVGRYPDAEKRFHLAQIDDAKVGRQNLLCSLSDDELSPAALALRVVLADTARGLVRSGGWHGARLMEQ
ncbi:LysR family transcriptional regulator [Cupriavidus plantarum]|uniref:LysR family transcriptional regulator n=1 Tax=Cupriavidus plantarum TaxID=942865 RepID=A0A316ES77_9BURK|nr:LysR substrate-binding domain-containing protein [Cupriavidus plantarum]NYI00906.1 LysR family tcuABC transcriptional regulator [Cupriavidus plantarum]PWK35317.1 LysR family transcriptional regulator [Cupriavidus plantarum]REE93761.1 LysR family transcriptional regulator [Cupriavidus plantarum]